MAIIYMATHLETNMIYIGQSAKSLARRIQAHYSRAKNSSTYFHRALMKYDRTAFEWIVLEEVLNSDASTAEMFWIAYYKSIGAALYNLSNGGESNKGYKRTEEQRMKNSLANKGKTAWNKGVPMREETKIKLSIAKRGVKPSVENKERNALGVSKGKLYTITGPDGTIYDNVANVSEFARQHGLKVGLLHKALKGIDRMRSHKGYTGMLKI